MYAHTSDQALLFVKGVRPPGRGGGGRGATFGSGGGVERLFRGLQMACKATF